MITVPYFLMFETRLLQPIAPVLEQDCDYLYYCMQQHQQVLQCLSFHWHTQNPTALRFPCQWWIPL